MSDVVRDYYNANAEQEQKRLDLPLCKVEFASALHLIEKYFPKAGHVCDIGGATGRYAIELLQRGYSVTLFDLSEAELRLADVQLQKSSLSADQLIVGDARNMGMLSTGTFDAALLMGPMYHVIDPKERAQVLRELQRVMKPGAVAIIAYLNSWGIIKSGITDFPNWYEDVGLVRSMLSERTFAGPQLSRFTECHWSNPPTAIQEIEASGLQVVSYAGAESFVGGMHALLERLVAEMPQAYNNIVQVASEMCELEQYRDSTDHLHVVVRVPDTS